MFAALFRLIDELVYRLVLAMIAAGATFAAVLLLYTVKSALGIDLVDGPSFMHDFYIS
jgi:hypothetical protein